MPDHSFHSLSDRLRLSEVDFKDQYLMNRYTAKAKASFKTKLEIYLFSKVIRDEKNITTNDFIKFKIGNDIVAEYEKYWQLEQNGRIRNKDVTNIENEVEEIRLKYSEQISLLEKDYIDNFKILFPKEEFQELVNQTTCSYCELSIEQFKTFREQGLMRKKQLTRGWDKLEIDRKYPNKEYTKENTVMSCYWCNNAKTDEFTSEEFKKIGLSIRNIWLERLEKKTNS